MSRYPNWDYRYFDVHRRTHAIWLVVSMAVFPLSAAWALNVRTIVVDPNPMVSHGLSSGTLEKTIDYFASTNSPSIIIGFDTGGLYLYTNDGTIDGNWSSVRIDGGNASSCYERSRSITFAGQSYPNIVVSCDNQISIFNNPANHGQNPTMSTWTQTVIASQGAHDIRVADIDQDGKLDIICSAAGALGVGPNFIAYQNTPTSWQLVSGPIPPNGSEIRESINILPGVQGSDNNIVGVSDNGGIYWFSYPGSRTDQWASHFIGYADSGSAVGVGSGFIVSANGEEYSDYTRAGLVVWTPPSGDTEGNRSDDDSGPAGGNPNSGWTPTVLDPMFAAVHEINAGMYNGSPYIVAAEQVQACIDQSSLTYHPGIGCRVTFFQLAGGSWNVVELDPNEHGSHNQSAIMYGQDLLVAGSNYGALPGDPTYNWQALQIWVISP